MQQTLWKNFCFEEMLKIHINSDIILIEEIFFEFFLKEIETLTKEVILYLKLCNNNAE